MISSFTHQNIDSMAWTVDRQGIDSIPAADLRELGFEARSAGVRPALVDLLVDDTAPAVVRDRAFGFVTSFLARGFVGSPTDTTVTPERVACAA